MALVASRERFGTPTRDGMWSLLISSSQLRASDAGPSSHGREVPCSARRVEGRRYGLLAHRNPSAAPRPDGSVRSAEVKYCALTNRKSPPLYTRREPPVSCAQSVHGVTYPAYPSNVHL